MERMMLFELDIYNRTSIIERILALPVMGLLAWRRIRGTLRPVVCVCKVNGMVGVVLRRDLEKASRLRWKAAAKEDSGPLRGTRTRPMFVCVLSVFPVFVFQENKEGDNEELNVLLTSCYVERGHFWIPDRNTSGDLGRELRRASMYIHGVEYPG